MQQSQIRIASYNIRKARGLDQRRDPARTAQVINALEADLIVLQEADKRLGVRLPALSRDLISTDTDFQLIEVSENGISTGWHGNAILLRNGHKAPQDVERIALPGLEPRGAVRVRFKTGLTVIAAHLGLRRRDRQAQLRAIEIATAGDPICVIAGDFNEWSASKGFEPLAQRFSIHSPGRSFHARRPIAALDRFALTEGVELRDAGVSQTALARVASDHLPIWSDIAIPVATC